MSRSICLLLTMGVLLTACQTTGWPWQRQSPQPPVNSQSDDLATLDEAPPPPEPGLQVSPDQRFPDIPLPIGVHEEPKATYVFQNATLAVGRMVYTSKASMNELAQFYMKECPREDWTQKNLTQTSIVVLTFEKPGKRLLVTILEQSVAKGGVTGGRELILELQPDGI
jgi:hypothetical protein